MMGAVATASASDPKTEVPEEELFRAQRPVFKSPGMRGALCRLRVSGANGNAFDPRKGIGVNSGNIAIGEGVHLANHSVTDKCDANCFHARYPAVLPEHVP